MMSNVARISSPKTAPNALGEPGTEKVAEAIKTLLDPLSPTDRESVLAKLTEMLRPIPTPRAGDVLSAIVRILPQRHTWTVDDVKSGVGSSGVAATPKEIYNALGYLTRKKHIRRVGYGQYIVDGFAVVTVEELGGAPTLHEDGHRID